MARNFSENAIPNEKKLGRCAEVCQVHKKNIDICEIREVGKVNFCPRLGRPGHCIPLRSMPLLSLYAIEFSEVTAAGSARNLRFFAVARQKLSHAHLLAKFDFDIA